MKKIKGWLPFIELCSKIGSVEEFERFFDLFLTIEEKHILASRYLIIKALFEKQLPQREIAKIFGVSIAQINRGSNALKRIDAKTEKFLKNNVENT
jgi:TrpR family trp operon transcriptional repressor